MLSSSYSLIKCLNVEDLCKNYQSWGPSARTCTSLMDKHQVVGYKWLVESAVYKFTRNFNQFDIEDMSVSHRIFVVWPCKARLSVTAKFASDYILGLVSHAYAKLDLATRQSFHNTIGGPAWFGATAGYFFESSVLLWLRHSPAGESLSCDPAEESYDKLKIPACRENMEFFSKLEDLKHVGDLKLPFCLVPTSQTFAAVDAIVLTKDNVITVQMTIASRHDAKGTGLEKIYDGLPSKFLRARTWCHVFLTDTEDKGKLLRREKVADVKTKPIRVYSAFFDLDELDSILTIKRAEELKKVMVSRYWQYAIDTYW
jgi:hypothetical protein